MSKPTCSFVGCGRVCHAKGWCKAHYWQAMTHGAPYKLIGRFGLASCDAETRARVASLGGRAAHAMGVAHQWNKAEARVAGRKGRRAQLRKAS